MREEKINVRPFAELQVEDYEGVKQVNVFRMEGTQSAQPLRSTRHNAIWRNTGRKKAEG